MMQDISVSGEADAVIVTEIAEKVAKVRSRLGESSC